MLARGQVVEGFEFGKFVTASLPCWHIWNTFQSLSSACDGVWGNLSRVYLDNSSVYDCCSCMHLLFLLLIKVDVLGNLAARLFADMMPASKHCVEELTLGTEWLVQYLEDEKKDQSSQLFLATALSFLDAHFDLKQCVPVSGEVSGHNQSIS